MLAERVEEVAGGGSDHGRGVFGVRRIFWTGRHPKGGVRGGEEGIWSLRGRSPPLCSRDGGAEERLMQVWST